MSYGTLDGILHAIEHNFINEDYLREKNMDYKKVLKVLKMMEKSEHKINPPPMLGDK